MSDAPAPIFNKFTRVNPSVEALQVDAATTVAQLESWLGAEHVDDRSSIGLEICLAGNRWRYVKPGQYIVKLPSGDREVLDAVVFHRLYTHSEDSLLTTSADILAKQPEAVQLVISTLCAGTRMELQASERLRAVMLRVALMLESALPSSAIEEAKLLREAAEQRD